MRAIKSKYALALNLSIVENEKRIIKCAVEQAIDIIKEKVDLINNGNSPIKDVEIEDFLSDIEECKPEVAFPIIELPWVNISDECLGEDNMFDIQTGEIV